MSVAVNVIILTQILSAILVIPFLTIIYDLHTIYSRVYENDVSYLIHASEALLKWICSSPIGGCIIHVGVLVAHNKYTPAFLSP